MPVMSQQQVESGSFRDRKAKVFYHKGGVYRVLSRAAMSDWKALSATRFFPRFSGDGKIVRTEIVNSFDSPEVQPQGQWVGVLKHERIPFISYPYEWSFGMLKDAGLLQLELLLEALKENLILKDSSAFNVQWRGSVPAFIDITSFEKLAPGEPWVGYRQFCQLFLYPLLLQAYKDVPFQLWLRGSLDGIESEHLVRLMSARDFLRPGVFTHVFMQARMQSRFGNSQRDVKTDLRKAGFSKQLIVSNLKRIKKLIQGLKWEPEKSVWADYAITNSYSEEESERKAAFVREVVHSRFWELTWDLGCNTGVFSRIAAENARYVVALDADQLAVERLFRELKAEGIKTILPLLNNLADPSPNLGWRGLERKSLANRGKPDLVLCLALIHHLVISANIPLGEFVEWLAGLGGDLVIEFITKEDAMVQTLLRNKEDNYSDYNKEFFEECLSKAFDLVRHERLDSGRRILYYAKLK
jgi:SAM-dependent methyltransferase